MKNLSLILNAALLVAVGVLYYLHFSGSKSQSTPDSTAISDLKIAYLRPGIGSKIIGKGKVIKAGNLLHFCESDIICIGENGEEILIARGYATMCTVKAAHSIE